MSINNNSLNKSPWFLNLLSQQTKIGCKLALVWQKVQVDAKYLKFWYSFIIVMSPNYHHHHSFNKSLILESAAPQKPRPQTCLGLTEGSSWSKIFETWLLYHCKVSQYHSFNKSHWFLDLLLPSPHPRLAVGALTLVWQKFQAKQNIWDLTLMYTFNTSLIVFKKCGKFSESARFHLSSSFQFFFNVLQFVWY